MSRDALRARDAGRETAEVTLLRVHRQVYDLYRDGNAVVNAQADLAQVDARYDPRIVTMAPGERPEE